MIAQLVADIEALAASLRRGDAINVNDQSSKDRAIELATRYFNEVKPRLVAAGGETERLLGHDEVWQQLVHLALGNSARRTYLKTLRALRNQLSEFNISMIVHSQSAARALSAEETQILQTLQSLVPSAAASYRQGLSDLANPEQRLSYRGTATEFRESLRETLDQLAPDADVEAEAWYSPEEGQKKPTMRQKVRYILTSRGRNKTQRKVAEKTVELVEGLSGEVTRAVYDRAALATHVQQSRSEVQRIKRYVDTVLIDLLEIAVVPRGTPV